MIYFYAEDTVHYNPESIRRLCNRYSIDKIIKLPTIEDIRACVDSSVAFISPYLPSELDDKFKNSSFFSVIELSNVCGVLTKQQQELGINPNDIMEDKFGIAIYEPFFSFDDMGGGEPLKKYTKRILAMEKLNISIKGIFLVGLPGTGKSFFAKCFSGETGRSLVELNLSSIMYQPNPIFALDSIFTFLSKQDVKYIIWIDEIEKQLVGSGQSQQVLGKLLTILNDLNTATSKYAIDAIFLATANNIVTIMENNPEFMRKGRFDELFFINYPSRENAEVIFNIYRNKMDKHVRENIFYNTLFNRVNTRVGLVNEETDDVGEIVSMLDELLESAKVVYGEMDEIITQCSYPSAKIENSNLITIEEQGITEVLGARDTLEMGPEKITWIKEYFKKKYTNKYKKDNKCSDIHEAFCKRLKCDFENEVIMHFPEVRWRKEIVQPDKFVYTPAEIENYVKEWFSYKVNNEKVTDEHYEEMADRMQPLQVAMKDGINKILAQKSLFIEV